MQIPTPTIAGLKIEDKSESPQSSDESSSSAESAPAEPLVLPATVLLRISNRMPDGFWSEVSGYAVTG